MNEPRQPPPPAGGPAPGDRDRVEFVREVRGLVRDFAIALLLCILAMAFLFQPFKVEGTSMEPRLTEDERILVNKLIYRLRPVERGDVVVFWFPGDPVRSFIKRVIGLPGDRVEIRDGNVLLNDVYLEEPYVPDAFREHQDFGPVLVEEGYYFVLGDHRAVSNDSRAWGMVPEELIYGKAFLRYWPFDRLGVIR